MGQVADIVTLPLKTDSGLLDADQFHAVGRLDKGGPAVGLSSQIVRVTSEGEPGFLDQLNLGTGFALSINNGLRLARPTIVSAQTEEWWVLRLRLTGEVDESLGGRDYHFEGPNASLLCCTPGLEHRVRLHYRSSVRSVSVIFQPVLLESRIGVSLEALLRALSPSLDPRANILPIEFTSEMRLLVQELIERPRTGHCYRLWAESKALELIALAFTSLEAEAEKNSARVSLRPRDIEQLQKVHAMLDRHYREPPTIERLCSISGINRRKLTEGFKILFGTTIRGHVLAQRMLHARSLLRQELPINLVAARVGYNDPSSFTKAFKRHFGVLPRAR